MSVSNKSLYIALPCAYDEGKGFGLRLFNIVAHALQNGWKINMSSADKVPHDWCRNELVKGFLASGCEWFMTIDSDVYAPTNIVDMIDDERLVVSPDVRSMKDNEFIQTAIFIEDDKIVKKEVQMGTICEVEGAGTGLLVIHRSVFEKLETNWFRFVYDSNGDRKIGEDYEFCRKVRNAGISIWYDTRFVCGHAKTMIIYGDSIMPYSVAALNKI